MPTQSKTRRTKIDTVAGAISTHQAAQKPLHRPIRELFSEAQAHFERIVESREFDSWTTSDLANATQLAQLQAQIDAALVVLQHEGRTTETAKGVTQHPEVRNIAQLGSAARALGTALGLSAAQRGLSGPEQAARNKSELQARQRLGKHHLLAGFDDDKRYSQFL